MRPVRQTEESAMSTLREAVLVQMRLRGFSPRTVDSYIHAMEELARFYRRPLDQLSCHEVQLFLDELIRVRKLSWSTVNVYFSAYRFLYEQVLRWDEKRFSIPPRGRSRKRPGVLSKEEVFRLLDATVNVKHRALLGMTYGSGLRVSETVSLEPKHIDRDRLMVFVDGGKGHKDRYTVLSQYALQLLEEHWRANRPKAFFFFGRDRNHAMSVGTAQQVYYQALERAGVRRVGGIHVLRHSFASHAVQAGVDLFTLKRWLGHRSIVTTAGYVHVTPEDLLKVVSPLDRLGSIARP